jgi:uncharacterized membrane protein
MNARWLTLSSVLTVSLFVETAAAQNAEFTNLGRPPWVPANALYVDQWTVRGMSADGSVLCIRFRWRERSGLPPIYDACLWTASHGFIRADQLVPPIPRDSFIWDVSADGTVLVGTTQVNGTQAGFRWTPETGVELLAPMVNAYCVSDDGSAVYGGARVPDRGLFAARWTAAGGVEALPGGLHISEAIASSADGPVCVGYGTFDGVRQAVRWADGGLEVLGDLGVPPAGLRSSMAFGCNREGDVVVGNTSSPGGYRAFRWTPGTGMQGLPRFSPDGGAGEFAYAVSGDGRTVLGGVGTVGSPDRALLWTDGLGVVDLRAWLSSQYSIEVTDTVLLGAKVISADGTVIAGEGTQGIWRLTLPALRPGDFDADREVTIHDLFAYIDCFVGEGDLPPTSADIDRDRSTDFFDLDAFLADF